MPVERRTPRSQTTTLIVSIVALAIAVILVIAVLRAAAHHSKDTVVSNTNNATFDAGVATERMASIKDGGPILFSDVSGGGQDKPIYVSHTGTDAKTGWQAFDAHPTGAPTNCFLKWKPSRDLFATSCDKRTFPVDGGAQRHYKWKVLDGELIIDLHAKPT